MKPVKKHQRFILYSLLLIFSVLFSGCVVLPDPEVSQNLQADVIGVIDSAHTISQTFKIRRSGFNGLTLKLGSNDSGSANQSLNELLVHVDLYSLPEPLTLIHHATVKLNHSSDNQTINISFPPQRDSTGITYTLQLSSETGSINVFGRGEDSYPNGQAYRDFEPINADIGFTTTYDYDFLSLVEDVKNWLNEINLIPAFLIILLIPGWLIYRIIGNYSSFDFGQTIGISIGLSMAVIPIALLWFSTLGIFWTRISVLFLSGLLVSICAYKIYKSTTVKHVLIQLRKRFAKRKLSGSSELDHPIKLGTTRLGTTVLLFGIFLITLGTRLIMVRDLATPAWVDSIHHALITRIILETGSLPETYLPYLDIESISYHSGFHSQLATFILLTNLDIPTAMLVFGQVLNALMVFVVFTLAKKLTQSNASALFAALITGVFTPMPAYYTSWGRYTQLSGLLILPAAYILFTDAFSQHNLSAKRIINLPLMIASIAAGGLFLVHYRVTAFFILLIVSDILVNLIFLDQDQGSLRFRITSLFLYTFLCILMILPWLIQAIPETFIPSITRPITNESRWFADFSWRYLNAALGKQALALAGLGTLWGLIQKKRFAYLLIVWIVLLLTFANLGALGLPGGSLTNTTSVEISLFIPISIFGGYFLSEIIKLWKLIIPNKIHPLVNYGILLLAVFIAFIGAKNITTVLNPVTFLSRYADISAIHWVEDNIPADKVILINPFLWGYGLYAGSDGGAWITPLTGRRTLPPPVLYTLAADDQIASINQISQFAIDNGNDSEGLHTFLTNYDIHYIYLGSRGGSISPQALIENQGFNLVYDDRGVRIFEILP